MNDYKKYIQQLDKRILELESKLSVYRNKEYEWNNSNVQSNEKSRIFNIQITELQQKITGYERDLLGKDQKIKQREN